MSFEITCPDYKQLPNVKTPDGHGGLCVSYMNRLDNCGLCALDSRFLCTEHLKTTVPRLSHSALQDMMTCDRLHYYKHIEGLEVDMDKPVKMLLGSLWDAVVDDDSTKVVELVELIPEFEVCRIEAMWETMKMLGISHQESYAQRGHAQHRGIMWLDERTPVSYVYDSKGEDYFIERKFTSSPKYYETVWAMQDQVGTYFLADDKMKYCIMELACYPTIRPRFNATKNDPADTVESFTQRLKDKILEEPAKCFKGLNMAEKTWGLKFYRNEFDLDMIRERYLKRAQRIRDNVDAGWYEMNTTACESIYGRQCEFLSICKTGAVGQRFKVRDKQAIIEREATA